VLSPSLFKPSTRECEQEVSCKKRLPCKSGKFEAGGAAIACDVSFFVCNNSLSGFAHRLALKADNGKPVSRETSIAIHDELAATLISGAMLVPSVMGAANALQEARFTYLP
jgi:hypothetical protein